MSANDTRTSGLVPQDASVSSLNVAKLFSTGVLTQKVVQTKTLSTGQTVLNQIDITQVLNVSGQALLQNGLVSNSTMRANGVNVDGASIIRGSIASPGSINAGAVQSNLIGSSTSGAIQSNFVTFDDGLTTTSIDGASTNVVGTLNVQNGILTNAISDSVLTDASLSTLVSVTGNQTFSLTDVGDLDCTELKVEAGTLVSGAGSGYVLKANDNAGSVAWGTSPVGSTAPWQLVPASVNMTQSTAYLYSPTTTTTSDITWNLPDGTTGSYTCQLGSSGFFWNDFEVGGRTTAGAIVTGIAAVPDLSIGSAANRVWYITGRFQTARSSRYNAWTEVNSLISIDQSTGAITNLGSDLGSGLFNCVAVNSIDNYVYIGSDTGLQRVDRFSGVLDGSFTMPVTGAVKTLLISPFPNAQGHYFVYVGGRLSPGSLNSYNLVRFNLSTGIWDTGFAWTMNNPTGVQVNAIYIRDLITMYVGGTFDSFAVFGNSPDTNYGGLVRLDLSVLDSSATINATFTPALAGSDCNITCIGNVVSTGGALFVGSAVDFSFGASPIAVIDNITGASASFGVVGIDAVNALYLDSDTTLLWIGCSSLKVANQLAVLDESRTVSKATYALSRYPDAPIVLAGTTTLTAVPRTKFQIISNTSVTVKEFPFSFRYLNVAGSASWISVSTPFVT